ncbi:MAG TPA: F0F1 ATP synthase subunit B [Candidatus Mcinerneyibacteriales bacterium]|nr:F0F1 ATP synthase subunit B [Candidatus Mcinerneyibacteriales bacterium]
MNVNWTLVFQAISFLILLFLLKKLVYQSVLDTLDKRKKTISDDLKAAETMKEDAREIKAEYEALMEKARARGEEERREIVEAAKKEKDAIIETARKEGGRLRAKVEKELSLEVKKAREELRREVAGLSVALAGKILEEEIDAKQHDRMIKRFLDKAGDMIDG